MALGQILREARIKRGFTESEVAERIKMNSQMIVDLETENYSRIAAPIYGKGYVRKYAEFLGIDYRPLVEEFKSTFGNAPVEKPMVSLGSYDLESGTMTKVTPPQSSRPNSAVQQPTQVTPIVQAAPAETMINPAPQEQEQTLSSPAPVVVDEQPSQLSVESESLFDEFNAPSTGLANSESAPVENTPKEEVFVPAHLATTPPTATIPPPNSVPSSVAQSRYTFSPEKFTPRTTVFKPEQLPSASAPEPIALSVAPFSYPEPEGISEAAEEAEPQETIFVSTDSEDSDTLFAPPQHGKQKPILTRFSGQTKDVEPEVVSDKVKPKAKEKAPSAVVVFFSNLFSKIKEYFKSIFDTDPEDDITKTLERKQRRLGFIFCVAIVVILIIVFSVGAGKSSEPLENEIVESSTPNEEIVNLVENKRPDLAVVDTETIEVVQILPTPKGFID